MTNPALSLSQRSLRSVWHPCTQMKQHERLPPLAIARGQGVWLYDEAGNRYLDGISSWWVNLFGHANPRINAALIDQLGTLEHAMISGSTHAPVVELSERLSALTGGVLGHAFYASDGASAVEIALKMSAQYWRNSGQPDKHQYVYLAQSYHGETMGALSVTDVDIFRHAYQPLVRQTHIAPSPDARLAATPQQAANQAAQAMEALLQQHGSTIAAVIVEPLVQCATGMAMHDPDYLRQLRALCDRYQVHLIADEIAVGCGRTGTFFACEQAGIWPDFITLSKGISGGYLPLSLVLTRDSIYQAFYDDDVRTAFLHSHSYTGNPLACRAALACLDIFESEDVLARNQILGQQLDQALQPLAQHPAVRHVRRQGMIWACDIDPAAIPDQSADDARNGMAGGTFSQRYHLAARQRGLLLRPIGNTIYLMPPYVLHAVELQHLADGALGSLLDVLEPAA